MRKALLFQAAMAVACTCSLDACDSGDCANQTACYQRAHQFPRLQLHRSFRPEVQAGKRSARHRARRVWTAIATPAGNTFLAFPDRGPNAVEFDDAIDNTATYINRFHTISMELSQIGRGLPYNLTPKLRIDEPALELTPLKYGNGDGLGVGSGVPPSTTSFSISFTGRSDNFDPKRNSGDPNDARFDTEGIRISNDGSGLHFRRYGPYVYEFDRTSGARLRSFELPAIILRRHLAPGRTPRSPTTPPAAPQTRAWKASPSRLMAKPSSASCRMPSSRTR